MKQNRTLNIKTNGEEDEQETSTWFKYLLSTMIIIIITMKRWILNVCLNYPAFMNSVGFWVMWPVMCDIWKKATDGGWPTGVSCPCVCRNCLPRSRSCQEASSRTHVIIITYYVTKVPGSLWPTFGPEVQPNQDWLIQRSRWDIEAFLNTQTKDITGIAGESQSKNAEVARLPVVPPPPSVGIMTERFHLLFQTVQIKTSQPPPDVVKKDVPVFFHDKQEGGANIWQTHIQMFDWLIPTLYFTTISTSGRRQRAKSPHLVKRPHLPWIVHLNVARQDQRVKVWQPILGHF